MPARPRTLTDHELGFFRDNGYVVVRHAVSSAQARAAAEAMWAFLEMDPDGPETWFRYPAQACVSSVEMYHHQAFWDNRQSPRVYGAFADLLEEERLWVSIDRASFKPPLHPDHLAFDSKGFIHWDHDPGEIIGQPLIIQGALSLTDTDESMGGFQCVPGHHRRLEEWMARRSEPGRPAWDAVNTASLWQAPALTGYPPEDVKRVGSAAGDLIIWDQRLPHGNGRNVSLSPRLAQYIAMFPFREENVALRDQRLLMWRERTPPAGAAGDTRGWEKKHCQPATLSDLGRRLLGLDTWGSSGGYRLPP